MLPWVMVVTHLLMADLTRTSHGASDDDDRAYLFFFFFFFLVTSISLRAGRGRLGDQVVGNERMDRGPRAARRALGVFSRPD